MKNHVKITFYLLTSKRKNDGSIPIYTRITCCRESVLLSTGMSVKQFEWNSKLRRAKESTPRTLSINERLQSIEHQIVKIANRIIEEGSDLNSERIKYELKNKETAESMKTLHGCFKEYLHYIHKLIGVQYSKASFQKYNITMYRAMQFLRMHYKVHDISVDQVNDKFLMDFELFLRVTIGNSSRTIQKCFQRLITVLNFAYKRGGIKQMPNISYKIKVPPKNVEYLTQGEVDRIENKEILNERLCIIRDLFIFSCYSGLSYRELTNLHESHLQVIDNQTWINMIRQKTKKSYRVPLLSKCEDIINKYSKHVHRVKKHLLFPVPSNQKFNAYLKELNVICDISIPLTCHLARRTFSCTILLRNKVPIQIVSELLGHSSTSITIKSYMGVIPELMISEFDKIKAIYNKE
jgi:integrase/recombinase XerD